jgi:hypothetical protein
MSNTEDQKLVDFLYENIFTQKLRCDYFNMGVQTNSVWNKYTDEKQLLDNMVDKYKKYYQNKAEEIRKKLGEQKEYDITSYLTIDTDYYINQYNDRIEELEKYLVELECKTFDHIAKDKLSSISKKIDSLFPGYMVDPTLLGKLYEL